METIDRCWRKSSYSGNGGGNCIEVAALPGGKLWVRDSKNPNGPHLAFRRETWQTFAMKLKASISRA